MSKKRRNTMLFMTGFISYFIGTGIYDYLIAGGRGAGRTFFSFGFAAIILGLLYLVLKQVKPEVINDMDIEKKDEREDLIRGKASQITLNIFYVLLFVIVLILIFIGQEELSYIIGFVYIVISGIHMVSQKYYEKRI